ncbi:MAG: UbiA-like polyprenyltransferase [Desulfosarcinaceae bacterium]
MIQKILRFTKIEHTAFSLPLLFTGAWMGGGCRWPGFGVLLLIVLAATGARIFGMSFNRILDRRIDAQNPRTANRELPNGTLSIATALIIALSGLAAYLAACAALGPWCLSLAPLPLVPLLGYSLLKRYTVLCHFGIGLCLALAPLGAFVAAAGHPYFSGQVLLFSGFVFFWLSGADIIYAIQDIESDRKNGIHSLPASLGGAGAQWVAAAVHLLAIACLTSILAYGHTGLLAATDYLMTLALFVTLYLPCIPVSTRFFPLASLAGVAGALAPLLV